MDPFAVGASAVQPFGFDTARAGLTDQPESILSKNFDTSDDLVGLSALINILVLDAYGDPIASTDRLVDVSNGAGSLAAF
jgi:hypothetical protein